jgi:glycosyltransferase involved in cell wall biosynthesis
VIPQDAAGHRIKLIKFVALFGCGGTERQFVNLGLSLDRDRFDLRFACMKRWGHFLSEVVDQGIPVREYPISRFASARCVAQQLRLAREIAAHHIEIVHAYNFYGNVFAVPAAKLASAPVIIAAIRDQGAYLTARQKAVQRHVCRLADCVLVNAAAIRDWLVDEGYDPRKIVVIRNGINLARFPAGCSADDLRRQIGFPAGVPVAASVSRLNRTKGLEHFLDAAALVSRDHPDLHVLIVGEGMTTRDGKVAPDDAYQSSLVERAKRLGLGQRIVFTGYRDDVPALLSQVSMSVLPSLTEGLSNVVLESMAAGVPVVATSVGGTPEVIEEGRTGLLVPPADPAALARAMTHLLNEPGLAAHMGRSGRRVIEEKFSMQQMVRNTEQLYSDLLAKRRTERKRKWGTRVVRISLDAIEGKRS